MNIPVKKNNTLKNLKLNKRPKKNKKKKNS